MPKASLKHGKKQVGALLVERLLSASQFDHNGMILGMGSSDVKTSNQFKILIPAVPLRSRPVFCRFHGVLGFWGFGKS